MADTEMEGGASVGAIPAEILTAIMSGKSFEEAMSLITPQKLKDWGIDPEKLIARLRSDAAGEPRAEEVESVGDVTMGADGVARWNPPAPGPRRRVAVQAAVPPQRAAEPRVQRVAAERRAPEPEEPEDGEPEAPRATPEDQQAARYRAALNQVGKLLARSILEIPGMGLGITFRPDGRTVDIATYVRTETGGNEEIARTKCAPARLGLGVDVVLSESYAALGEDDDEDDDDLDGDEDFDAT